MGRPLTAKDIIEAFPPMDPELARKIDEALAKVYEPALKHLAVYGVPPSAEILAELAKMPPAEE